MISADHYSFGCYAEHPRGIGTSGVVILILVRYFRCFYLMDFVGFFYICLFSNKEERAGVWQELRIFFVNCLFLQYRREDQLDVFVFYNAVQ